MRRAGCAPTSGLVRALRCAGVGLALAVSGRAAGTDELQSLPLVLTQVPRASAGIASDPEALGLVRADGFEGARVAVWRPGEPVRVLSEGFHSACDPNVSFDGERVLFAGKQESGSRWRIWEVGLDGRGLRAVSPGNMDARSPIHVSTLFTLDSPQPWFTTVFVGLEATLNEQGRPAASALYNIKLDGTELRRLTFNPNPNFDPFQMWDGRVLYAAERHPNTPGAGAGRVGLYAIHVEGADMELYGGERGGRIQQMPCATAGGLVVFVESDRTTRDGAGQLACVEERRPHVTYRRLTQDPALVFTSPSPWKGNRLLVSRRAADGTDAWAVFAFDADARRCEPVFSSPDHHAVQAVVAGPRDRPDGHSTVVDTKFDSGLFYGLNCYDADPRIASHLETGTVRRVRLIEGVPQAAAGSPSLAPARGPFVHRRLVGEAPVEADGSFNVEVPADVPLLLQTLDERGLALATCGWIWVKPKEKRGCIGCHEDPERIPENEYVKALRRPSNRLVLPPAQRRAVNFRDDVAPLLQQHCATADCHGGSDTPLVLPLAGAKPSPGEWEKTYAALLAPLTRAPGAPEPWPQRGRYVDPGRARTSWLIWQLAGAETLRPWDAEAGPAGGEPREVRQMPPPGKGTPLRPEDLRTIIQWIDLGAQFEGPAAATATETR